MPMVTVVSKKQVEENAKTLAKLEELCKKSRLLRWKKARRKYIFSVHGEEYETPKQADSMMAVAEYSNGIYAVYPADYLKEEQFNVFDYFIRSMGRVQTVVVFDKSSYDAVMKYSRGRNLSVHMSY